MQDYFKEMTDQDIRRRIYDEQRNQIEQDMAPLVLLMTVWVMIPSWTGTEPLGVWNDTRRSRYMWNY